MRGAVPLMQLSGSPVDIVRLYDAGYGVLKDAAHALCSAAA
ncbi:hypothetical protein [Nonomuraea cavernae]